MSPNDYRGISQIRKGPHPEDGSELRVVDGPPAQLTATLGPTIDQGMLADVASRLFGKGVTKS